MKNNTHISGFTLIEIIVSVVILGIIMISILGVYINSVQIAQKSEFHRILQENVKNALSQIGEDVKKNTISWVGNINDTRSSCTTETQTKNYISGQSLCISYWSFWALENRYILGKKGWSWYIFASQSYCSDIENQCFLLKNLKPLTNNLISVEKLEFRFMQGNDDTPKMVWVFISVRPVIKKGLASSEIEKNKIYLQTTFSERIFK